MAFCSFLFAVRDFYECLLINGKRLMNALRGVRDLTLYECMVHNQNIVFPASLTTVFIFPSWFLYVRTKHDRLSILASATMLRLTSGVVSDSITYSIAPAANRQVCCRQIGNGSLADSASFLRHICRAAATPAKTGQLQTWLNNPFVRHGG